MKEPLPQPLSILSGDLGGEGMGGSLAYRGFDLKSNRLNSASENKMTFPTLEGTGAWPAGSDTWIP